MLTVVDRDVSDWCAEGEIKGNSLSCCQMDLCNSAKTIISNGFIRLTIAAIIIVMKSIQNDFTIIFPQFHFEIINKFEVFQLELLMPSLFLVSLFQ